MKKIILTLTIALSITTFSFGESFTKFACGSVTEKIIDDLSNWSVATCRTEFAMSISKQKATKVFNGLNFNQNKECFKLCSEEKDDWESCANRYKNYFVKGIQKMIIKNGMKNLCNKL